MIPRAFAVVSDAGYFPGLYALLNSIWIYHHSSLPVYVYHGGLDPSQVAILRAHPAPLTLWKLEDLPFHNQGTWEAKQQVFAHCLGKVRAVCLLDADLVLASEVSDLFALAETGKIAAPLDGGDITYDSKYTVYHPALPGTTQPYLNSGALCLDVVRHWDLVGLWSFAARFAAYSPAKGPPLALPGHGDQGVFNAVAGLLGKRASFHPLPEATWCDSTRDCVLQIRGTSEDGRLEVWNLTANSPQRLVHNTGPKWWTDEGRAHLTRLGDKLKCFLYFHELQHRTSDQVGGSGRQCLPLQH